MDYTDKIISACEARGTKEFLKDVFIKDEESRKLFMDFITKYHPSIILSSSEDILNLLDNVWYEDPALFSEILIDYMDSDESLKSDFEIYSLSIPDTKYDYAVLTDLGRSGAIIQIARKGAFEKMENFPGHISDDFIERMKSIGFNLGYNAAFETRIPLSDIQDELEEIADFNEDMQDYYKANGTYYAVDIEPTKKDEKKGEKTKEEATDPSEASEDDDVSAFFGFKVTDESDGRKTSGGRYTAFGLPEPSDEDDEDDDEDFDYEEEESETIEDEEDFKRLMRELGVPVPDDESDTKTIDPENEGWEEI